MFVLRDWSRPSMVSNRPRSLSLNWTTFTLMAISFRAITDDGDRTLHCQRLGDLGRGRPGHGRRARNEHGTVLPEEPASKRTPLSSSAASLSVAGAHPAVVKSTVDPI